MAFGQNKSEAILLSMQLLPETLNFMLAGIILSISKRAKSIPEMGGSTLKKACLAYGLILATILRIIIPFSVGSDALNECTECAESVVAYYSLVSRSLFALTTLVLLSTTLAELTDDWISVVYVPLLVYTIRSTSLALLEQLISLEYSYYACMKQLSQNWYSFFNNNDTYWPNLERKLQCCGWEGPRDYMEYLRKVPGHCYDPELITLGCGQIMLDLFDPMPRIGQFMRFGVLALEICLMNYYGFTVCIKLFSLARRHSKSTSNKYI